MLALLLRLSVECTQQGVGEGGMEGGVTSQVLANGEWGCHW